MSTDNVPWLVCVTTDDGSRESGNIHYTNIHVYPDRDSALAAARGAFASAYKEEEFGEGSYKYAQLTDTLDNWLLVRPADVAPVTLQCEPEDEDDEERDDAGLTPVQVCCNAFFGFLDEETKP